MLTKVPKLSTVFITVGHQKTLGARGTNFWYIICVKGTRHIKEPKFPNLLVCIIPHTNPTSNTGYLYCTCPLQSYHKIDRDVPLLCHTPSTTKVDYSTRSWYMYKTQQVVLVLSLEYSHKHSIWTTKITRVAGRI
jgi:hypothetical protein